MLSNLSWLARRFPLGFLLPFLIGSRLFLIGLLLVLEIFPISPELLVYPLQHLQREDRGVYNSHSSFFPV